MAIGDKLYLADKPTLDTVKNNIDTANANIVTVKNNVDTANNSITAITNKVGTNADASGTTTLFARAKQIYDYLVVNLSTARTAKIDNLDATISTRATATALTAVDTKVGVVNPATAGTDTLFNYLKKIWDKVNTITGGATTADIWSYGTRQNTLPAPNIVTPTTNIRLSAPTERSVAPAGQFENQAFKVKEFVIPWTGVVRVQSEVMSPAPANPGGMLLYGALYLIRINGVTVYSTTQTYSAYTQIATNIAVKAGDTISIHITRTYWYDGDECNPDYVWSPSSLIRNAGIGFDFSSIYGYTSVD